MVTHEVVTAVTGEMGRRCGLKKPSQRRCGLKKPSPISEPVSPESMMYPISEPVSPESMMYPNQ